MTRAVRFMRSMQFMRFVRLKGATGVGTVVALTLLAGCNRAHETAPEGNVPAVHQAASGGASAAADAAPASAPLLSPADAVAMGAELAASGVPSSSIAACSSCHGTGGEGNAAAGFPRLAGQPADYLIAQLVHYANGSRRNEVMQPIAHGMSPQQRQAAAVYYAGLEGAAGAAPATPASAAGGHSASAAAMKRGQQLAEVGDNTLRVQACANCHGPGGTGMVPLGPALAAQPVGYLDAALKAWADGSRRTDPTGQMPRIAQALPDADRQAVASWFAAQPAPRPASLATAQPPATAHPTAVPSGPTQATREGSAGAEQGTPTTGGAIGPGGGGATRGTQNGR